MEHAAASSAASGAVARDAPAAKRVARHGVDLRPWRGLAAESELVYRWDIAHLPATGAIMTPSIRTLILLLGTLIGGAGAALGQASPGVGEDASTPGAAAAPETANLIRPAEPTADQVKRGRNAGYRIKLRRGSTLFCKSEAPIGSHFEQETCIGSDQLELVLKREELQRAQLANHACFGGGACGGVK